MKLKERNWTNVGKDYNETDEQKQHILSAINAIDWIKLPEKGSLSVAMMPGEAIKNAIKELRIPKVSHIAISNALAPYGFYGIRGHYKNGTANIYLVDAGCSCSVVMSELYN